MAQPESPSPGHRADSSDGAAPPEGRSSIFSGVRLVGLLTLCSRVLGLVRDVGMAALFGNGAVLDAFTVAFRIPNLSRRLFGEGALTAAFLPAFVRELRPDDRTSAWQLASATLGVLVGVLCGLVIVGEFVLWLLWFVLEFGPETELLLGLTAIMLPYLVLICAAALISAVFHAFDRFTLPALLPILLNVVWLVGLWIAYSSSADPIVRVQMIAGCVVLAGCVQLASLLPSLRRLGFRFIPAWQTTRSKVADIARGMAPIVVGLSVTQLNTLADSLIAWGFSLPESTEPGELSNSSGWMLAAGTASALYFGQRMYQFPLGVFGVALGTVLFPRFSRHAGEGRTDELRDDFMLGLRLVLAVGIPAGVGLWLLAAPLTDLLFRHGAFDADDARQTAGMIASYGIGVWAFCGLLIANRAFYAVGDRSTPLRAGLLAVVVNLALDFALLVPFGGRGLALATSITAMLQVTIVIWLLQRRLGDFDGRALIGAALRIAVATLAMTAVCHVTLGFMGIDDGMASRVGRVFAPITASIVVYLLAARVLGIREVGLLLRRGRSSSANER